MASNSGVQQSQQSQLYQQQQQENQRNTPFPCKECGTYFNSAESLEVHLQYHKENLMKNWVTQASSHSEETNNNTTSKANIKREFIPNNTVVAAENSDSVQKKSPDYSRTTPETIFGHPPTPQSYHSASSPYQNQDNSAFSPNFQNFQPKTERLSPNPHYQNNYQNFQEQQFFNPLDSNSQYNQDYPVHKGPIPNPSYRYHPYGQPYERTQASSSSSPAYPPQPTPSPSPKQCDKCGYVCESASQLIEHQNMAHPPTPLSAYQPNQHFMFGNEHPQQPQIKTEEDAQSEILDLDSHKVVHQVYPEEEKRQNGDPNGHNPHSVSAMLNTWSPAQPQQHHVQQQHKMFEQQQQQQQRMFMAATDQKMFQQQNIPNNIPENKMFSPEQKIFQSHQLHNSEFMSNGVTSTTPENTGSGMSPINQPQPQPYRPFEHLPSQNPAPVISNTQVPTNQPPTPLPPGTKASNWKSNEARRPKTYNCTACNKWFTSSGHLKRHYNTTLHKNAVKSSGAPDPATMPISVHHHPARDSSSRDDNTSNSPGEEMRGEDTNSMPPQFDRPNPLPGLIQQPPNGPYDRQPAPNIHHTPPLHSPMGHSPMSHSPMQPHNPSPLGNHMMNSSISNLSNGSPPNGEAGLSPNNLDTRGLLSLSSPTISMGNSNPHGFNMAPPPMMSMESSQYQMYPNESAPHVTQAMAINNLNTTGEFQYEDANALANNNGLMQEHQEQENQPLPSFAQFHAHRYGGLLLNYDNANVGGGGPVTAPYTSYYITEPYEMCPEPRAAIYRTDEDYKLTVLTAADASPPMQTEEYIPYTTLNNNTLQQSNNLLTISTQMHHEMDDIKMRLDSQPNSPEKARTKRDFEEQPAQRVAQSTITKNGMHKCIDCDKMFNKACYLTQHNKTFHSGDKPFKCTRCGKRFSCEITYQEHLTKHAGEKPHKCDLCPKQFNHKTDLRRHMCLHTGQKPYACDTCGKGFIRKDHMMKHCETHIRKTQSKMAAMR